MMENVLSKLFNIFLRVFLCCMQIIIASVIIPLGLLQICTDMVDVRWRSRDLFKRAQCFLIWIVFLILLGIYSSLIFMLIRILVAKAFS